MEFIVYGILLAIGFYLAPVVIATVWFGILVVIGVIASIFKGLK